MEQPVFESLLPLGLRNGCGPGRLLLGGHRRPYPPFPSGGFTEGYPLHAYRDHPTGVAVFPAGDDEVGIAVSYALDHVMEFYVFSPPNDWQYLGIGTVPWGYSYCFGLVFDPARETFFMLIDGYTCCELLEISVAELALAPGTWGSIKAGFR